MFRTEKNRNVIVKVAMLLIICIIFVSGDKKQKELIYILQWTPRKTEPFNFMESGQDAFINKGCNYTNCFITNNRSYFNDVRYFDVILFNAANIRTYLPVSLPAKRSKYQKYVFVSTESSENYPVSDEYNGIFNWTWTYKINSDINFSYITVKDQHGVVIGPKEDMHWMDINDMKPTSKYIKRKLRKKSKAATWFVSNCDTTSDRLNFAKALQLELQKYLQVLDIYGECGNLKCPVDGLFDECYALIESDYYFYLAFENSFSDDYVTEKLLTALEHFAVPIVYGGANYTRFMPDGIYLDAGALGPTKLAKKINDAVRNKKMYYEYFKWHRYYSFHDARESPDTDKICTFCAVLNNGSRRMEKTMVKNVAKWWNKPSDQKHKNYDWKMYSL